MLPDGSAVGNTTFWNGTNWVVNNDNIYNSGNLVGIGTNDPTAKLDINGQLRVRGGAPGSGKVLTSDANGLATWEVIPAVETGTLNQAYNVGGPGAGREIIADSGAVLINGTDGLLVTGTLGQGAALEVSNTNPSMLFYPRKAAFRVGRGESTTWSDVNIGDYSVAMGSNTIAKGISSFAMGAGSQANADYSIAFATGQANGNASVAMGFLSQANGLTSSTFGNRTKANGSASTAMGFENIANGSSSLVIGRYNDTIVSRQVIAVDYTPLFIIGNGTGSNARSNAMVVRFDGRTGFGVNAPDARLDIDGQVKIRGGNPAAGKVLTSDPSGLATWESLPEAQVITLDEAYDAGGFGLGREIIADSGAIKISGHDGIIVSGTLGQGQDLDINGAGTRMFFYPKKAAFRAGGITNSNWDIDSIGDYSLASGYDTKAIGLASTSMGYNLKQMELLLLLWDLVRESRIFCYLHRIWD
ncbi:MAG: hypothetical protein R2728_14980 [Chitinophagales bacterium]